MKAKHCPNPNGKIPGPVGPRFWTKVRVVWSPDDCWEWTAGLNEDGYGVFATPRHMNLAKKGGYELAHRMAWRLLHREDIPTGLRVLHICDNRKCVRPQHLFLGTQRENVEDAARKGRMRAPKGESHPKAKLTEAQVIYIRAELLKGRFQKDLAAEFGVSQPAIGSIHLRKTWKGVK